VAPKVAGLLQAVCRTGLPLVHSIFVPGVMVWPQEAHRLAYLAVMVMPFPYADYMPLCIRLAGKNSRLIPHIRRDFAGEY